MKSIQFIYALFLMFFLLSCQEDVIEVSPVDTSQSIEKGSPLTNLIKRASQSPTFIDDVIDKCNCFKVEIPYKVTVNNIEIAVSSPADYKTVKNAIAPNPNNPNGNKVRFIYPIKIRYKNFELKQIDNENQLVNAINSCKDKDEFEEIDCVEIKYPISLNIYNKTNEIASTKEVKDDQMFYNFLENITSDILISIKYPVAISSKNGSIKTINNNSEFVYFLEDSISDCLDDDQSNNDSAFIALLTSSKWKVSYCFDKTDITSNYIGYNFTFNTDKSCTVIKDSNSISGNWKTKLNGNKIEFELSFTDNVLDKLEQNWKLIEYNTTTIRLRQGGGDNSSEYLYFIKN
jgi:hypothetical protein